MTTKSRLDELLDQLKSKQQEVEDEIDRLLDEKREEFHYSLRRGKIVFERKIRQLQRQYRKGLVRYVLQAPVAFLLTAPIIYGMVIPIIFLDLAITVYQHVCFRVYGIPRVKRSDYIVIDRHHLAYLNIIEKLNCVYCGYGNGLISYAREITARTEQYWCPIKHARRIIDAHKYTDNYIDYGDAKAWDNELGILRKQLAIIESEQDLK